MENELSHLIRQIAFAIEAVCDYVDENDSPDDLMFAEGGYPFAMDVAAQINAVNRWADATEGHNRPYVAMEAVCGRCGETFNPADEGDTEHVARADGSECGGHGEVVGVWR